MLLTNTHTYQLRIDCVFLCSQCTEFMMCSRCTWNSIVWNVMHPHELKFMFGQMCTAHKDNACTCSLFYTIVKCNYYVWSIPLAMLNERSLAKYNKNNQCNTMRPLCYVFASCELSSNGNTFISIECQVDVNAPRFDWPKYRDA